MASWFSVRASRQPSCKAGSGAEAHTAQGDSFKPHKWLQHFSRNLAGPMAILALINLMALSPTLAAGWQQWLQLLSWRIGPPYGCWPG